jgi:hypothetical protein
MLLVVATRLLTLASSHLSLLLLLRVFQLLLANNEHMILGLHCRLLLLLLTLTPSCSTAFMPISTLSSTVQPCSTAPWPTETPLPTLVLLLLGLRDPTDTPSCRLVLCPISTSWLSPAHVQLSAHTDAGVESVLFI